MKATPTIIASDLTVDGDITGTGSLEVEGKIKGTVKGNSVIIREGGKIEGALSADTLIIKGSFDGSITANAITISSKGIVTGNIDYNSLSIEDGACIDGQFKKVEKAEISDLKIKNAKKEPAMAVVESQ